MAARRADGATTAPQPGPGEGPWQGPGPDAGAGQGVPPGPGAPPAGGPPAWRSARHPCSAAPAGGTPVVGRQAGQRLARAELSKAIYHPQPSSRSAPCSSSCEWLNRVFRATQRLPGGWWGFVVLIALAVLLVAVVLTRTGPVARARRRRGRTRCHIPGPHRAASTASAAARLAGACDYAAAICERVRAIAAELDERGVLMPRIGRTADEFAAEAGRALPPHAAGLLGAARLFDEVRYGRRPGTRTGYDRVTELDTRIAASAGRRAAAAVGAP